MKNLGSIFAAFTAFWAIFFLYYWSVSRRLGRLRDDVERLREQLGRK